MFQDRATGDTFRTRSTATSTRTIDWSDGNTYPLITVDISAYSHPFWTGRQRVLDTAGQVEKFHRRYGM
ncbi:MAG: type B 50S ribosomal protein L31 [Pseudonocardiaceae bacterium]